MRRGSSPPPPASAARARASRAMRCATDAEERDLLGAVLALGLGAAQRLVGALAARAPSPRRAPPAPAPRPAAAPTPAPARAAAPRAAARRARRARPASPRASPGSGQARSSTQPGSGRARGSRAPCPAGWRRRGRLGLRLARLRQQQAFDVPGGEPLERARPARACSTTRASGLADPARVGHAAHPGREQGVALAAASSRPRACSAAASRRHRGFSPRCRYAMPSVSGSTAHRAKPACSMSAANAAGVGKARHRRGQVRVGRAVAAHQPADPRQHGRRSRAR